MSEYKQRDLAFIGSGNIFADLGLENSEELLAKSTLARTIREIIKHRDLTQSKAAKLLDTHQTQISRLNSGEGLNGMSPRALNISAIPYNNCFFEGIFISTFCRSPSTFCCILNKVPFLTNKCCEPRHNA